MNRVWLGAGIVAILVLALILSLTSGADDPPVATNAIKTGQVAPSRSPVWQVGRGHLGVEVQ